MKEEIILERNIKSGMEEETVSKITNSDWQKSMKIYN